MARRCDVCYNDDMASEAMDILPTRAGWGVLHLGNLASIGDSRPSGQQRITNWTKLGDWRQSLGTA